ncbi:hypothetical protein [Paenibacillus albus]|uniref:Uncharacterized protein n=1 Tax=Paenibacillus albus TaxID=2495582 RepID=A0A3Q8X744_9BACL|nr:hypothetical protein [Paenibacillus albus]AZN40396.1 hypothetical protein EJC50_12605 [Paenibacillus albus]
MNIEYIGKAIRTEDKWFVAYAFKDEDYMLLITDHDRVETFASCFSDQYRVFEFQTLSEAKLFTMAFENKINQSRELDNHVPSPSKR